MRAAVLVAITVLLAGCDQGETAASCSIDVDTQELRELKASAAIEDCPPGGGDADLPDVELACLGGGTAGSLAEVEGPALINFWASNCGPCVKEMPALAEFDEQYGDQVAVLGVDYLETYPGAALELAKRSGVTYPSFADPCGDLQESDLVLPGLPVFVFVSADGSVAQSAGGVESVEEIVELTEKHLDVELEQEPA
ncbi:TlpA family protein disulfide reductase [Nocardioides antri]|uniref:TlpA family protein disulfide reductase n=1 Tax=Nocardioides antri TaxID=2607659 RepID=A0A5B1M600_9ACTN|nr:TlpA disulfide reductase family protein [Nocardioides antri]KAA1428273.1 TlpA family protein disulfide reductase [Nocardioides antri]